VTFHYKHEATNTPSFGLIAEEVAEVSPDLTVRDENGEIHAVRYDAVNAMLLNDFLKAHRKAQQQEATITELKRGIEILTAQFKEQAAQIQKVSAQLEVSKPAPRTVLNK
jgi:sigma54-dependent transcription regulator